MKMTDGRPPVVITGLCDAMSLFLIRSFGRKGIPVIAVDSNISSWYSKSKYCKAVKCNSLFDDSLITSLVVIAKQFSEKPVLFNCTDQSVLNVSRNLEIIQEFYEIVLPSHDKVRALMSKRLFYNFANRKNICVPKTFFSNSIEELEHVSEQIAYPSIVKPEFREKKWLANVPFKVLRVGSREDLMTTVRNYKINDIPLVIQEWIEGDDTDLYFCLTYINRNKEPAALVTGRKLRQHPHLAGTLSVAETVWEPEVIRNTLNILMNAGCVGFGSVEFKRSRKDKKLYVMEPTVGRPDSQEGIFGAAGEEIAQMAYNDAIGCESRPLSVAAESFGGIKWIDEPRMYYTIREYIKGTMSGREFLGLFRGKKSFALWDMDDPLPFLNFAAKKIQGLIRKS